MMEKTSEVNGDRPLAINILLPLIAHTNNDTFIPFPSRTQWHASSAAATLPNANATSHTYVVYIAMCNQMCVE